MEQDQEQRHICKFCSKSFLSGKVLGGHMRCHLVHNPSKRGPKTSKNKLDLGGEGNNNGYGLRENPRKSWKFSGTKQEDSGQEHVCNLCGKGFDSMRALFGHMRHHSGKQKKGISGTEYGEGFDSVGALTSHERSHSEALKACNESGTSSSQKLGVESLSESETRGVVRRKRSIRTRYKIDPNSCFSNLTESSCGIEIDQEMEEGALCLMMLSKGVGNWAGFNSFTECSENCSVTLEVKSSDQSMMIRGSENVTLVCDVDDNSKAKKRRIGETYSCVAESKRVFSSEIISEHQENDDGFLADEENRVELDVEVKVKHSEVENDDGFLGLDSEKKIQKEDLAEIEDNCQHLKFKTDGNFGESSSCGLGRKKKHKCSICFKIFASGQALGGHKRAHVIRSSQTKIQQQPILGKQKISNGSNEFDLNVSEVLKESGDGDVGFRSWWSGSEHKHELLVV